MPSNQHPTERPVAAPEVFDRKLLRQRRERALRNGDPPDFLLSWVVEDIVDRLSVIKRRFPRVLNLGAHTGGLGRAVRQLDGVEFVVDADPVARMLARCSGPAVMADEEALPFANESFDLIVSGLSLQFVNDLPGALIQIRKALKPDGVFLGAMLGGATLHELRAVFTDAELEMSGGASPRVAPFADVRDLGSLLQRAGLALPVADADTLTVTYRGMLELVRELRAMGAGNVLASRLKAPMRRQLLWRAAEIYAERFGMSDGRIPATFEVITMTGWAPAESQQKPLRPGSARVRLADALGTKELPANDKAKR
ncbi:MAG TPA: methyltransferase domain-containing protein [Hyphomicrobiaceae bacterium]|nr:methyltransferase domain-containing protein [Hyphomicrobiaceae bacterium]